MFNAEERQHIDGVIQTYVGRFAILIRRCGLDFQHVVTLPKQNRVSFTSADFIIRRTYRIIDVFPRRRLAGVQNGVIIAMIDEQQAVFLETTGHVPYRFQMNRIAAFKKRLFVVKTFKIFALLRACKTRKLKMLDSVKIISYFLFSSS